MAKRDLQRNMLLKQAEQAASGRHYVEAEAVCRKLLARDRRDTAAMSRLALIAMEQGQYAEAAHHLERCTSIRPRDPSYHINLGMVRTRERRFELALRHYQRAAKLAPKDPRALSGLAHSYEMAGDVDKAHAAVEPVVRAGTDSLQPVALLARLELNAGRPERTVELANEYLDRLENPPPARRSLFSTLGKAYEKLGEYEKAFEAYRSRADVGDFPFSCAEFERSVDALIETFSAERVASLPRADQPSETLIFIVGMPRSGSTLIETILDAHPGVHGGGEMLVVPNLIHSLALDISSNRPYPECVVELTRRPLERVSEAYVEDMTALAPQADRIVDKFLGNYRNLGLIAMLVPRAHVIHARRNALDNCLSCFAEDLPAELHPYAAHLDQLGFVYRQYDRLVSHYRDVLEIPWLDVQYEEVVADQEGMSRRIIDFCGLPWDDACLRFYESGRQAGTASYDQVRRPIYKSAMGRAERFGDCLDPLREALAE